MEGKISSHVDDFILAEDENFMEDIMEKIKEKLNISSEILSLDDLMSKRSMVYFAAVYGITFLERVLRKKAIKGQRAGIFTTVYLHKIF